MSESMTRGADVMLVQGATVRLDRAGLASTMPLTGGNAGPIPLMLDADRFAGLVHMGITRVDASRGALGITTTTGLRASLPTLADPHRTLELSVGADQQAIAPELFAEWLQAALGVSTAAGTGLVNTYRSHVFAYNRLALVAYRLSAGWPMPGVVDASHLRDAKRHLADAAVVSAHATRSMLLAQAGAKAVRLEARDAQLAQAPINMLTNLKAHQRQEIARMPAAALAAAVKQIQLTHSAHRDLDKGGGDPVVDVHVKGHALVLQSKLARVEVEAAFLDEPDLPAASTTLAALKPLAFCEQFSQNALLVAYPERDGAAAMVVRTSRAAMFVAAKVKA